MNILSLEHLTHSYTERKLFDDADFYLHEGDKVGVIGINGTGKSTLIKIMAGLETPDEGQVIQASNLMIHYLPQNPEFSEEDTVLQSVQNMVHHHANENELIAAKAMLTRLGITDFEQKTRELSGGQRKRLALVSVLITPCDVLILDEPTNHLDSEMADWLENKLQAFRGALVMVTHDRYFLDNIVDRIFAFEGNGHLTQYEGGYTDYTEALARKGGAVSEGQSTAVGAEKKKSAQADWKQNRPQKLKFTYKEQREFETIDDDIAALEELLEKLDKDMEANATNSVKLREIMEQKEKAQTDLDEKMDRWVYLNDLSERIEAQKSDR